MKIIISKVVSLVALVFSLTFSASGYALIIFSDNFEGNLDQWQGAIGDATHNASIGPPSEFGPTTKAVHFGGLQGFHFYTTELFNAGDYTITFDYAGDCSVANCGGAFGYSPDFNSANVNIVADASDSFSGATIFTNINRSFASYTLDFTATNSFHLTFGDLGGFGGILSDAYFDNIELAAVPLPAAFWLFASGLVGLFSFKKKQQKT